MKTLIAISLNLLLSISCCAQSGIESDSSVLKKESKENIVIRCAASVNNDAYPLILIDGVSVKEEVFRGLKPNDIESIELLKEGQAFACYGSLAKNGVILVTTKNWSYQYVPEQDTPFTIHKICNTNWNQVQDVYNAIQTNVPGVVINQTNLNSAPNIRMRGDDNTIVIVDGIRTDASILNIINPADIKNVKVATGIAASNYLLNTRF